MLIISVFFLQNLCKFLTISADFRVPSLFLSENETLSLSLRDYFPNTYPKIELLGATNQFFSIKSFENLEEFDHYSFESSSSLQKVKFLKEINALFLLFKEKCSIFFLEKHNERFLKIIANTKLKYSMDSAETLRFTCFDLVFLQETREILFDCDCESSENRTKTVFLSYFLQESKQFLLKNASFFEKPPSFACKRLLQRERGLLFRRCARNSNFSAASSYEIFEIFLKNASFYEISLRNRVNVRDLSSDLRSFLVDAWILEKIPGVLAESREYSEYMGLLATNTTVFLVNVSQKTAEITQKRRFSNETLLKLHRIIYESTPCFLLLSKKSLYFLRVNVSNPTILQVSLVVSLQEASTPQNLHYTRDHLLVEYKYFIKIYRYSSIFADFLRVTAVFLHFFEETRVFRYFTSILFIEDVEIISILWKTSDFLEKEPQESQLFSQKTTWRLNFSQISSRFFELSYSFSLFSLLPRESLQNSNVSLLINDQFSLTIAVFFWNLSDTRVYFFESLRNREYFLLKSETFAINLENFVIGALPKANLSRKSSIKPQFSVQDSSYWTFDYSSILKENLAFSPQNFLRNTLFLYMEAYASSLSFLWQSSQTNLVSLINCFEIKENLISDCVVLTKFSLKVAIIKALKAKSLLFLLDSNKKLYYLQENLKNPEIKPVPIAEILCEDFEIHAEFCLFFCVNHQRGFLDIYSFSQETADLAFEIIAKHETFAIKSLKIDQLFIDFFNMGCLIVKSAKILYFIEIISEFPANSLKFLVKTAMRIESETYSVFLVNSGVFSKKLLIIDLLAHNIKEFSLQNPLNPQFSRQYPVFHYKIRFCVLNSQRYLGIVARNPSDNAEYFLFYDIFESTSSILKRKVNLEAGCLKYNVKIMSKNVVNIANSKVYALLLVIKENEISFKTIENIKLLGNLKTFLSFPQLKAEKSSRFLTFRFVLYYFNTFHAEKVFHLLNITAIPSDMLVLAENSLRKVEVFETFSAGTYSYFLKDGIFQGPITNYMLINEKNVEFSNFNAFLAPTGNFLEYHEKLENYGNVISMDFSKKDQLFVVLSEKMLTFFDVLYDYRVIYQYQIEEGFNCLSINQHKASDFLVIFCKFTENYSTPALYLQFFFYSYERKTNKTRDKHAKTDDFLNKSSTFDNFNEDNFSVNTKDFTFSVQKIRYKNGDSEIMDNNFVSSDLLGNHLIILAKEYYSSINSVYIFQIPAENNEFSLFCKGKIELFQEIATNSAENLFFSSENLTLIDGQANILDFLVYESNKTAKNQEILTLGFLILNEKQGSFLEYTINRSSTEECLALSFTRKFVIDFFELLQFDESLVNSIKLLTYSLIEVSELLPNFTKISFFLTTSLEIFELELLIFANNFTLNKIYSYRSFFSCSFVASTAIKLGNFLGAFCEKDSNEIRNYFVLYKKNLNKSKNESFSHPIRSLPLLISLFEVIFIEKQANYAIILPSYLNVFQEYALDENLTIFKGKKPLKTSSIYSLIAYNDISKTSCDIIINVSAKNSTKSVFIVIIAILVVVFLIILVVFAYIMYLKRKKKKTQLIFNEDMKVFLETWAEFNKKRDESLHSTMTASCEPSSFAAVHKENKENKGDNLENSIKHSKKSDRYSVEVEVKKKIKNFNKNF